MGHPYGGFSTGTLQYLCLKTEDVFSKLEGNLEKAQKLYMKAFRTSSKGLKG